MKTISIITDSLAMPRVEGKDVVYIHETWPKLLAQKIDNKNFTVAEFTERARDTESLNTEQIFVETIKFSNPAILILQIGIVECAPRIISKFENKLLNKPFVPNKLRRIIINTRKKNRNKILKKGSLKKVYVKPADFSRNMEGFIDKVKECIPNIKIILIPILGDYLFLEEKSLGYLQNINLYNQIIKEISEKKSCTYMIHLTELMNNNLFYSSDGYHLNAAGHEKIYHDIYNQIL